MIQYEYSAYNCAFLFRLRGSVFPFACLVAFPCTLAATLLKSFGTYHDLDLSDFALLAEGSSGAWSGFNFLVGFVIVFRTSQAYTRFWNALSDTHQMMAAWLEAASSIVAFSRSSPSDPLLVENWLHTVIRLFSLLSASALQELTDVAYHHTWGLPTLDASAIDPQSINTLDASSCRVDLLYHWIQQFVCDGIQLGILTTPPPLLNRTFFELAKGMDKYQDAMKHSKIAFPFPYAQTTLMLLIFHWILTPLVMVQWTNTVLGSAVFTFVQVFTLWCLNATAVGFERPFGGDENDIDHIELQMTMNKSLINLMEPRSRRLPFIPASTFLDIDVLRKRDTIHSAALHQEGWELKDLDTAGFWKGAVLQSLCAFCSCRCRSKRANTHRSMIAVSTRYSSKRYCVIDGQRTAVLTVGIVGSELRLALPALPNDSRSTFGVLNVNGQQCTLRAKRIPIQQRHLLTKAPDPAWNEDYLDFPPDYNFAAEVLAKACDTQRGSRAVVKQEEAEGEEEAKAVTRGVSQHLRDGSAEEAPEAGDKKETLLPGSVQDFVHVGPTPSIAEKKVAPSPSGGGVAFQPKVGEQQALGSEGSPGKDSSEISPQKVGPREMVLPWGSDAGQEELDLGEAETPEGGHVLPWGANPAPEIGKDTHHVDEDCATGGAGAKEQADQEAQEAGHGEELATAPMVSCPEAQANGISRGAQEVAPIDQASLQDTSGLILAAESALLGT